MCSGGLGSKAVMQLEGLIAPFPGGIVASGSKPGADTYTFMRGNNEQRSAPTLKDKVEDTNIPADVNAVYELVINGIDIDAVAAATKAGIEAAVKIPGVKKTTAGNYGGSLGQFKVNLSDLF